MTGAELRCYEGPVWGGTAPTPPKTRFPRRTLGNGKSARIPTCGFISPMISAAQTKARSGRIRETPYTCPGASRSVLSQGNAVDACGGERDCNFWALRREGPGYPSHGWEDANRLSCAFPSALLACIRRAHGEMPKN